ncbi:MAG TPA: redoxin family protein [Candidatus Paceibacterota bacterium]|nr:redoxin family protein [Candidatus Paceibacterota bacterium]
MKRAIALFALIGLNAVAFAAAEVGKPAPNFTGTDITGKTHRLSDYKGKVVVLESYNSDCPFCGNHFKTGAMQELQKEMTGKGVIWLMVNSVNPNNSSHRTPEHARAEWTKEKMNATAWIDDSSGAIGKAYGMKTTPHMFVIDQSGKLVYDGAIDDRPSPFGDPRTARNYVREAVNKVLAGEKVEVSETKPYGCAVRYGG